MLCVRLLRTKTVRNLNQNQYYGKLKYWWFQKREPAYSTSYIFRLAPNAKPCAPSAFTFGGRPHVAPYPKVGAKLRNIEIPCKYFCNNLRNLDKF